MLYKKRDALPTEGAPFTKGIEGIKDTTIGVILSKGLYGYASRRM